MKLGILLLTMSMLAACSSEPAGSTENNGWALGDDAGNGATDAGANNGTSNAAPNNVSPNTITPNNVTPTNNTTVTTNNSSNNTTAATNNSTSNTNNVTMGNGGGVEGDLCMVNSACGAGLTCCPGFNSDPTCQPQCFGGGLCGGNDAECAGNEVCCDFSGINQPDSCTRPNLCRNNNGNPGTPCQNNNECQAPEVCCLGFDGTGECTTECFTGGACELDTDCLNGQLCCDITVAKVCLDQCGF